MSDNKEQCRAEFEAYMKERGHNDDDLKRPYGNYFWKAVGDVWDGWEAAYNRYVAQPVVLSEEHPFFQLFLCTLGALALHDQKSAEEYGAKARAILAAKEQA